MMRDESRKQKLTTQFDIFVRIVAAVVVVVATPAHRYAAFVAAREVARRVTGGALAGRLVTPVTTIVLAVTHQPRRYAAVVIGTPLPIGVTFARLWKQTKSGPNNSMFF